MKSMMSCIGTPWQKYPGDSHRLELGNIDVRNDPADEHRHVVQPLFPKQFHQSGADVHVGAAQNRQADHIRVFLQRRRGNLLGRLAQPRVNHFHAGIPERPGDHLGTAVVPIESGLGDDDARRTAV